MLEPKEKVQALQTLQKIYQALLDNAERERADAQLEANSHVGAMESRYDTFKEEAQYLAQAHLRRTYELQGGLNRLQALIDLLNSSEPRADKRARLGSVVTIETEDGKEVTFFVSPFGGGETLEIGDKSCKVITPESRIGKAIVNHQEDDEFDMPVGKSTKPSLVKRVL